METLSHQSSRQSIFDNPDKRCPVSGQSFSEEVANAITHGVGFVLSVVGFATLVITAHSYANTLLTVGCVIYGSALILLYGASTFYHCCSSIKAKKVFQVLDHVAIYLLIAGSYTPYIFGPLRGALGWTLFAVVWGISVIGITVKIFISNKPSLMSTFSYLFLGWISVVIFFPLLNSLSPNGFFWLLAGGAFYSVGVIFFLMKKLPFNHSIWHLFVLGGSICHYVSILNHVIPGN